MNLLLPAKLALLALLLPGLAMARSSDRNQPMTLESSASDCNLADENGTCVYSGDVIIEQGSLRITAARADIFRKNGEINRVLLTGKQAHLSQLMEDGTPMKARANSMDYNVANETIVLVGDYNVESPRGTNSGQRMTYNMVSGNMQSGGDGTRVRTVLQPKSRTTPEAN